MKCGLVMEGGAMRGMFTAGVTDVLMENKIAFHQGVGVSAGAAFGCNYKSNQPGRVIRYNTRFCTDKRYVSLWSLITTGDLYGAEFCYATVPKELDPFDWETYRNSPMEFYAVCTNVETGKPIYHNCAECNDEDLQWIRASASMPLVSRVVHIGKYALLDGGMSDSIPLAFAEEIGCKKNLVILTQPKDFVKTPNSYMFLVRLALRKYPNMIKTMENRHIMYNDELDFVRQREKAGAALVIRPPERLKVGAAEHNPDKLRQAYQIGRKEALDRIEEIKEFTATDGHLNTAD